jgi:hypothetical protein
LSWHTLAKMLVHDAPPGYRRKEPRRRPKLAEFLPVIQQILTDDKSAPKKQAAHGVADLRAAPRRARLPGRLHDRHGRGDHGD